MDKNTLIIGLTGSFGSGCTEAAKYLAQKKVKGFLKFSLSDIIRDEAKKRNLQSPSRKDMQNIGDELRKNNGPLIGFIKQVKKGGIMKKKFEKCSKCGKLTVRYESRFYGKRCSNPECNWTEAKLTAADVPKSFLESCLESTKNSLQKDRIERIITDTFGSL